MALLVSFVPTFMKEEAPKELKILEDDRPELDEKTAPKKSD
jgi:hypothetical protein